jgi:hypothetical protein
MGLNCLDLRSISLISIFFLIRLIAVFLEVQSLQKAPLVIQIAFGTL